MVGAVVVCGGSHLYNDVFDETTSVWICEGSFVHSGP